MKLVFFGTPSFVDPVLKVLEENFEVVEKIRSPQQFDDQTIEKFKKLNPDLFVVASYGQILPRSLLQIPKLGAINIHPSLLPKYRGSTPIQTAILNGDKKTGVTFIKMDEEIDHGPIIEQFEEEILSNDTFKSLAERLFQISADKLSDVIVRLHETREAKPQDETKATYTKTLTKQDGFIDIDKINQLGNDNWKMIIARRIRAYHPWPGVWTKSSIINHKSLIIKFLPEQKLQVEGKKPMSYKDFINGYPNGKILLQKLSLIEN